MNRFNKIIAACFIVNMTFVLSPVDRVYASSKSQVCPISSTCFDNTVTVDGVELNLVGATLFRYWGFKVYSAAFYMEADAKPKQDALKPVNKYLVLNYHRAISKQDIVRSSNDLIDKNPRIQRSSIEAELNRLYSNFLDVKDGDRFAISYNVDRGMSLYFNGKQKTTISGELLQRAYFGIWLSAYNVDLELKNKLLGK